MSLLAISTRYFTRGLRTTSILQTPRSLAKLKKNQADFQCEDGRPVWLKAGLCDRILYSSTVIGCYIGIIMVLGSIYDLAKPTSWKTSTC